MADRLAAQALARKLSKSLGRRITEGMVSGSLSSAPKISRSNGSKIYVCTSDIHTPADNRAAVAAVLELVSDIQPDGLVFLGDVLDFEEISRHNEGSAARLEGKRVYKTFDAGNLLLDQFETAAGRSCKEKWWLNGNHCDRVRRFIQKDGNVVFMDDPLLSIDGRLGLKDRGYNYIKEYPKGHIKLGRLLLAHGQWSGKYAASAHLNRYNCSVLVGHVHTPGVFYGSGFEKQHVAYVQGHLADVHSAAMDYPGWPNSWQLGFSVITVEDSGNFHVQLVNFVDGVFYYAGKRYGKRSTENA